MECIGLSGGADGCRYDGIPNDSLTQRHETLSMLRVPPSEREFAFESNRSGVPTTIPSQIRFYLILPRDTGFMRIREMQINVMDKRSSGEAVSGSTRGASRRLRARTRTPTRGHVVHFGRMRNSSLRLVRLHQFHLIRSSMRRLKPGYFVAGRPSNQIRPSANGRTPGETSEGAARPPSSNHAKKEGRHEENQKRRQR